MWKKKLCWVVTAFYREELFMENKTPIREEEIYPDKRSAIAAKEAWEQNDDIADIYMSEEPEEKEVWVKERQGGPSRIKINTTKETGGKNAQIESKADLY